jgi:CRISPR/Cas system-associated exonuclease Cas4 (RecB family)
MKAATESNANRSDIFKRMDSVRMNKVDRRHAEESLRDGERIAEVLFRAAADLRSIVESVEHAAASLADAVRAMFAKPAKH